MGMTWDHVMQVIILILALRALHMVSASTRSCAEVNRHFTSNGIGPDGIVPRYPAAASDLRVCPNGVSSCCNNEMEHLYKKVAIDVVHGAVNNRIASLKFNFDSFARNFQTDILATLEIAGNSTRAVLRKFLRKRKVAVRKEFVLVEVEHLFYSLGLKANRKEIRRSFDRFADRLFLFIVDQTFNITNRDIPHEECVMQQRKDMNLFVDVSTISAENVSTAIGYARAVHEALPAGALAVDITDNASLTKYCQDALLKMQYCSHCWGLTLIKPCMGLCKNVMRGCLAGISELDQYWNYYVTALASVTSRMSSSQPKYNLEIALKEFENKLLSAISTFLGNVTTTRKEVETRCENSRTLKRSKRSNDDGNEDIEQGSKLPPRFSQRRHGRRKNKNKSQHRSKYDDKVRIGIKPTLEEEVSTDFVEPVMESQPQAIQPPHILLENPTIESRFPKKRESVVTMKPANQLHKRMKRFMKSLNDTINYYRYLPHSICDRNSGFSIQVSDDTSCWDGNNVATKYDKDVVAPGYEQQLENPEVRVLRVEKYVVHAIEKLRRTALKLMSVCGTTDTPDILMRSPVYEERIDSNAIEKIEGKFPCDDEDECEDDGSGEGQETEKANESKIINDKRTKLEKEMKQIEIILIENQRNKSVAATHEASEIIFKCKGDECLKESDKEKQKIEVRTVQTTPTTPDNSAVSSSAVSLLYIVLLLASKFMFSLAVPF